MNDKYQQEPTLTINIIIGHTNLRAATRSFEDRPSGSPFVLGNIITGIPFSLAYCAPPQSTHI